MKNRQLLNLLRANADKPTGVRVEASADEATIYVYGPIDAYWGVSAADFCRELAAISAKKIVLRINSPGGDVFEARAMMTALREKGAEIVAKIDGLAASAATALALAADRVEIADGGFYMIHQAWTLHSATRTSCARPPTCSARSMTCWWTGMSRRRASRGPRSSTG